LTEPALSALLAVEILSPLRHRTLLRVGGTEGDGVIGRIMQGRGGLRVATRRYHGGYQHWSGIGAESMSCHHFVCHRLHLLFGVPIIFPRHNGKIAAAK
jgi:hypothetical protein